MALDVIVGIDGADFVNGGLGDQLIRGGAGDDVLNGNVGDDHLFGNVGEDELNGGLGDDYLAGGLGNDTLRGGPGTDVLKGGPGSDTFVFTVNDFGSAIDTILDFNVNDILDIAGFVFGVGTITAGDDNKITFAVGESSLVIQFDNGFSASDFTAANFA